MKSSSTTFHLFVFLSSQTASIFASSPHRHFVTGSQEFVIVNSEEPQLYRLFGVLPFLNTLKAQLLIAIGSAIFFGLLLLLYFLLRPRHPYADWTSRLPDSVVHLLFYLQLELTEYKNALWSEIMTLMNAPLAVGLDIASNVVMWSPMGSSRSMHGKGSRSGPYPRTGRSLLRRKQLDVGINLSRKASTSKESQTNTNYPGLYNTGNSCFLNSTIQSLAALDLLRGHLENAMELAETWDVPTPVMDALHDLITELNTPLHRRSALMPRQLTDALSNLPQTNVGSFFYAHQQQDAHELLVLLTSAIDDEMNLVLSERDYLQKRQNVGLQAAVAPSIPSLYSTSSSVASTSSNPFRSLIAQRTACLDCGYVEAVRHYPADELSLAVPYRAGSASTLEACLKAWSKLERVDWVCFRCSLEKTLEKVRGDVKRMLNGSVNGHSIDGIGQSNGNGEANGNGNGTMAMNGNTGSGSKMSNSKKKRLREVRRKETVLSSILDGGFSEDEVESAGLLEKADIKLERTFSTLSTKQVMIARTPKLLLLHLNRSSYSASNFGASKNNSTVLFDEYLDISDVVTSGELNLSGNVPISRGATPMRDDQDSVTKNINGHRFELPAMPGSRLLYRLCAIVVHYGSHSAGHYVSFRRRTIKQKECLASSDDDDFVDQQQGEIDRSAWFRISDDTVTPCSFANVLAQNPFLLFYEQINGDGRRNNDGEGRSLQRQQMPNRALIPSGFECFAKNEKQKNLSHFKPRVVERWNYGQ